jgi:hypothetical protein
MNAAAITGRPVVRGGGVLQQAAQQFEQREGGVVEGDDDGAAHAVVLPQRLDQVRAFDGGVPVVAGFVGVTLPDRLDVQPWTEIVGEHPVDLGPAVGAVREAGQQGEPHAVRALLSADHPLEDLKRAGRTGGLLLGHYPRRPRLVPEALAAREPLLRRHRRPVKPRRARRRVLAHREPPHI